MSVKKILVIDDSPTERHFLTEILSKNNYQVITAVNGAAAGSGRAWMGYLEGPFGGVIIRAS